MPDAKRSSQFLRGRGPLEYLTSQVMKKHQPALLQKYMTQSHHNAGLRSIVVHDKDGGLDRGRRPLFDPGPPAPLTPGCSAGVSRNQA